MRRKEEPKNPAPTSFWQSYSDMMAALLLVFVLIIAFTVTQAKVQLETKEAELEKRTAIQEQQAAELEAQAVLMKQQESELEAQRSQIVVFQEQVTSQQEQIDAIVGVRTDIILKLRTEFAGTGLNIDIDSNTGAITFDSSVLFDFGKSTLKPSGTEFLNSFFPKYFDVIFDKDVKDYVAEIIIEGHTDNEGSYLYNLELSQKRAFSVAQYCLGEDSKLFDKKMLGDVRQIVTANGRSYNDPVYDEKGKIDAEASRRVEVKFRLKEDDMIEQLSSLLESDFKIED